ncbi:hypothetical protein SAMN04488570_3526 [Nocardioides scoriae]|uniref:Uncharacterized protein n=1 Tax=Nocardioides scoriae TaxID=642780 RepID=A0A1H1XLX1_9ACTN|nr:hypothetical protein [Nocardioides scoriae]SDT10061.1 hypothetical protein SAMN04488570_3526 [Nocardioides scoriae]
MALVAGAGTLGAATPASAAPGVCAGVSGCRVVRSADVDGNGTADQIGVVRKGGSGADQGTVTVRVRTRPGTIVKATRTLTSWSGPVWQGSATLDERTGKDLVVGFTQGAHAEFFRVLTFRGGKLVTLPAPGGGTWTVDGALMDDVGWARSTDDPRGLVRARVAERDADGVMQGTVTTWRHSSSGWKRGAVKKYPDMTDEAAGAFAGWKVAGLPRF